MTEKPWTFALNDSVELYLSGETGIVIGRAEYTNNCDQYLVRYLAATGVQVEAWMSVDAIQAVNDAPL